MVREAWTGARGHRGPEARGCRSWGRRRLRGRRTCSLPHGKTWACAPWLLVPGARPLLYGYLRGRRGAARLPYPLLRRGIATAEAGRSGGGGSDRPRDRCRAAPSVPALAPGEGTDGGLWTGHHLSSPSDGCTFDGGDSASFRGQGLTRLGVFAIRQGAGAVPQPSGLLRGKPWKCPARLTATLKRRID